MNFLAFFSFPCHLDTRYNNKSLIYWLLGNTVSLVDPRPLVVAFGGTSGGLWSKNTLFSSVSVNKYLLKISDLFSRAIC